MGKHGLYVDGQKIPYDGWVKFRIGGVPSLEPPVALKPGQRLEAWKNHRLIGVFLEQDGIAVASIVVLHNKATNGA